MKHNKGRNLKLCRKGSRLKLKITASLHNFLFVKRLGNVICFLSRQATCMFTSDKQISQTSLVLKLQKNSVDAVHRLGTIIQSIFLPNQEPPFA